VLIQADERLENGFVSRVVGLESRQLSHARGSSAPSRWRRFGVQSARMAFEAHR
jgi:hypothetical protein